MWGFGGTIFPLLMYGTKGRGAGAVGGPHMSAGTFVWPRPGRVDRPSGGRGGVGDPRVGPGGSPRVLGELPGAHFGPSGDPFRVPF